MKNIMFLMLFGAGLVSHGAASPVQSSREVCEYREIVKDTLHAVFFVATDDNKIWQSVWLDHQRLAHLSEFLASQVSDRYAYKCTTFSGPSFSAEKMRRFANTVTGGPNDVLLFVYLGHGFNDPSDHSRLPVLTFSSAHPGNYLPLAEVQAALSRSGYGHVLMLVDACNKLVPEAFLVVKRHCKPHVSLDTSRLRFGVPRGKPAEALLQSFEGLLLLTADTGEVAIGDPEHGTFFAIHFDRAVRGCIDDRGIHPSMESLLRGAASETKYELQDYGFKQTPVVIKFHLENDGRRGCCKETGQACPAAADTAKECANQCDRH